MTHIKSCLLSVTILLSACAISGDEDDRTTDSERAATATDSAADDSDAVDLGECTPKIKRIAWRWFGCGASASALPFSLAVDVELAHPAGNVEITGQATLCKPFAGSGMAVPCDPNFDGLFRTLVVDAALPDGTGSSVSAPISDCVDGELVQ